MPKKLVLLFGFTKRKGRHSLTRTSELYKRLVETKPKHTRTHTHKGSFTFGLLLFVSIFVFVNILYTAMAYVFFFYSPLVGLTVGLSVLRAIAPALTPLATLFILFIVVLVVAIVHASKCEVAAPSLPFSLSLFGFFCGKKCVFCAPQDRRPYPSFGAH